MDFQECDLNRISNRANVARNVFAKILFRVVCSHSSKYDQISIGFAQKMDLG